MWLTRTNLLRIHGWSQKIWHYVIVVDVVILLSKKILKIKHNSHLTTIPSKKFWIIYPIDNIIVPINRIYQLQVTCQHIPPAKKIIWVIEVICNHHSWKQYKQLTRISGVAQCLRLLQKQYLQLHQQHQLTSQEHLYRSTWSKNN